MTIRDDPIDVAPPAATVITVTPDGPYVVTGDVEIRTADGDVMSSAREVALCRCGQSANKPYCDGSHQRVGFCDPGPAARPLRPPRFVAGLPGMILEPPQSSPCAASDRNA